jgi:putative ABC transport system substrate-binding protein
MVIAEADPEAQQFVKAIETQLDAAGWHKGRNLEITYRWGASDPQLLADHAQELVSSAPDVLLALGTPALVPLHKATTTIPIVFTSVSDPVAQGFVASLARPGGNVTGFSNFEPNIGGKWLQLLKEVAPSVTQTSVMFNPHTSPYNSLWMHSIEVASPSFGRKCLFKVPMTSRAPLSFSQRRLVAVLLSHPIHSHFGIQLLSLNLPANIGFQLCMRIPGSPTKVD